MRALAILLLLAVLPTAELVEQAVHVIEHVAHGEAPGHSAHHDGQPGDEHGCTGLVHLCANQVQVTTFALPVMTTSETIAVVVVALPAPLADKDALEPPHRPPIG